MYWLLNLISPLLDFLGKLLGFRREQNRESREFRRKAYSAWLTSEELVQRRIRAVCEGLRGFPQDQKHHDAVVAEVQSLLQEVRPLVIALNEALLSEPRRDVRRMLQGLHESLLWILDQLEFAAQHYTENLRLHETVRSGRAAVGEMESKLREIEHAGDSALAELDSAGEHAGPIRELLAHRLDESRRNFRRGRGMIEDGHDLFLEHDKNCPFKSPKFGERIRSAADDVHRQAAKVRELVAQSLN